MKGGTGGDLDQPSSDTKKAKFSSLRGLKEAVIDSYKSLGALKVGYVDLDDLKAVSIAF